MADPAERDVLPAQGLRPVSVLKIAGTDMVAKWDYDRVLAENEELKGWAVVGQRGHCPHSKTVKDCAGCTIRVLMATLREIEETLQEGSTEPLLRLRAWNLARTATR